VVEITRTDAGVRLRLVDDGHFLVTLGGIRSGGSLAVHSESGGEAVALAAGRHGGNLGVSSSQGELVAWINVSETGAHIVTRDRDGNITSRQP
jgi:hypothetical protein